MEVKRAQAFALFGMSHPVVSPTAKSYLSYVKNQSDQPCIGSDYFLGKREKC
jgi:hypothetical protein